MSPFAQLMPETWSQRLNNPWLVAGLTIAAAFFAAHLAAWVLRVWLSRLASRTSTSLDDEILRRLRQPVIATIFLYGLDLAARRLMLEYELGFAAHITSILRTLVMLNWIGFGLGSIGLLLRMLSGNARTQSFVQPRVVPLYENFGKLLLVALAGYTLSLIWGIDATAWLTSAGIFGLALGFAAKDTLGNLFSGIFILADTPYKIGDYINLDSGERGKVTQIGLRSTRLLTRDDIEIVIPNAVIAAAKIVNETGGPHMKERLRLPVGVAYGSDVDRVVEILEGLAVGHEGICEFPEPRVRFRLFGASSLDFELLCWIEEPELRGRRRHELNMEIYKAFAANGIQIPFPQRDVHIIQAEAQG